MLSLDYSVLLIFLVAVVSWRGAIGQRDANGIVPIIFRRHPTSEGATVYFDPLKAASHVLACEASASPAPSFTWRHNGAIIPTFYMGGKVSYNSSGPSGRLLFSSYDSSMEGSYQCTVTNGPRNNYVAISETVQVATMKYPLADDLQSPLLLRCNQSEYVSLRCSFQASDFVPPATITWVNSRNNSAENANLQTDQDGNLHISMVSEIMMSETYRCRAQHNQSGIVRFGRQYKLNVTKVPPQRRAPTHVYPHTDTYEFTEGEPARVSVIFSGNPIPTMRCSVEGVPIPSVQRDKKHRLHSERYTLFWNYTTFEDAGMYTCNGCSGLPTVCSDPAYVFEVLLVTRPAFLVRPNVGYIVKPGDSIEIDCSVRANPEASYTWLINGQDYLTQLDKLGLRGRLSLSPEQNKYTLTNARLTDSHMVQCIASNYLGSTLANVYIVVFDTPTVPPLLSSIKTTTMRPTTRETTTTTKSTPTTTTTTTTTTTSTTTVPTTTSSTTTTTTTTTTTATTTTRRTTETSTTAASTVATSRSTRTLAKTTAFVHKITVNEVEERGGDSNTPVPILSGTSDSMHGATPFPGWWVTVSVMAAILLLAITVFFLVNGIQRLRKW